LLPSSGRQPAAEDDEDDEDAAAAAADLDPAGDFAPLVELGLHPEGVGQEIPEVKRTGPDRRHPSMETPGGGGSGGSRLSYQMPFWVIGALTSSMARVDRPYKGRCRVYVMDAAGQKRRQRFRNRISLMVRREFNHLIRR
jgi:hypothetical protein